MRVMTGRRFLLCIGAAILQCSTVVQAFVVASTRRRTTTTTATQLAMVGFFGGSGTKIPVTASERDNQAIQAIKAAVAKPKTPQLRLIECEFPPLQELNKLGDGSWQSAKQVDGANLAFGTKCCQALSPLLGNRPTLLTSSSATASFFQQAQKAFGQTASLKNGPPQGTMRNDIFVLVAPSGPDYVVAKQLATQGATVVLINGFAKDNKSVPDEATMAYFLKPLTYNSQVAGYLVRAYPQPWTTLDAATKTVLTTATDDQILVKGTNTPDLRAAVKSVQKSVDARAIASRQQ